jgi:hypothetical protein
MLDYIPVGMSWQFRCLAVSEGRENQSAVISYELGMMHEKGFFSLSVLN